MPTLNDIYQETLDRPADPAGIASYGAMPLDQVRPILEQSPEGVKVATRRADPYLSALDSARSQIDRQINAAIQEISARESAAQANLSALPQQYETIYGQGETALNQYASSLHQAQQASGMTPFAPAGAGMQPILGALAGQKASNLANVPLYQQAAAGGFSRERSALETERANSLQELMLAEADVQEQRRREQAEREWQLFLLQLEAAAKGGGGGGGGGRGGRRGGGGGSLNTKWEVMDAAAYGALSAAGGDPAGATQLLIAEGVDPLIASGAITSVLTENAASPGDIDAVVRDLVANTENLWTTRGALYGLDKDDEGYGDLDAIARTLPGEITADFALLDRYDPDLANEYRRQLGWGSAVNEPRPSGFKPLTEPKPQPKPKKKQSAGWRGVRDWVWPL